MPLVFDPSGTRKHSHSSNSISKDTSKSSSQSNIIRGNDIDVDEINESRREFWPAVSGWKDLISQPIPYFTNFGVAFQVTGRDKVGKSHLSSIIASAHSRNHDVLYVTTEFPAPLIHQKLVSLGADPSRLVYIDYSEDPHNVLGFAKMGSGATPFYRTRFYRDFTSTISTLSGDPIFVVVDSLTSFYEAQEWSGRLLTGNLVRTIRSTPNVLAFIISQKRTQHSENTTEVAGGLGVSHLLDGTIIMSKYRIQLLRSVPDFIKTLSEEYGGAIHLLRWDGNRWGPHPEDDFVLKFTESSASLELNLTRAKEIMGVR